MFPKLSPKSLEEQPAFRPAVDPERGSLTMMHWKVSPITAFLCSQAEEAARQTFTSASLAKTGRRPIREFLSKNREVLLRNFGFGIAMVAAVLAGYNWEGIYWLFH